MQTQQNNVNFTLGVHEANLPVPQAGGREARRGQPLLLPDWRHSCEKQTQKWARERAHRVSKVEFQGEITGPVFARQNINRRPTNYMCPNTDKGRAQNMAHNACFH